MNDAKRVDQAPPAARAASGEETMVIICEQGATQATVDAVIERIKAAGLEAYLNPGVERPVIAVLGVVDRDKMGLMEQFIALKGVERVQRISAPYKLPARSYRPEGSTVRVGDVVLGGEEVVVIAGPCSVENREQLLSAARAVKAAGGRMLRGGAFKPRTSPYSFQGLGEEGLKLLAEARELTGLPIVTEILDPDDLPLVAEYADVFQVGARNMSNFRLLQRLGRMQKPVLLKRSPCAKLVEMLQACEYIMCGGNENVMLCERGVVNFDTATRNITDINAVPVLKRWSHLPVVLDPSHSTGDFRCVGPIARAGVAAGADALILEIHPDPANALSDGGQSLTPKRFTRLMGELRGVAAAVGRTMAPESA